ncbi:hypothetical protein D5I55_02465 [Chakrabartia godavariana]|nr:hypothetical protein D5I55_02465 [Chakrabartia godavariana]
MAPPCARPHDLARAADEVVFAEIENWQAVFGGKQITVPVQPATIRTARRLEAVDGNALRPAGCVATQASL